MNSQQAKVASALLKQFNEVQKLSNFNKVHVFELVKIFKGAPEHFAFSLEQAYLKIFKSCLQKVSRKIPSKFESLVEALFNELIDFSDSDWESKGLIKQTANLFNSFLGLCIQAIYSSVMNIRIMGARLTFLIVKLIPQKQLSAFMTVSNQENFASAILHLLRMRVSTYRQLGAKLASLVQNLPLSKVKSIQSQLLRIVSLDDNDQIRKIVMTNMLITPDNIDKILIRLRDKNIEIRSIIIKKLQNENYVLSHERFSLSQLYKLLYDGYGSKQSVVKTECLNYFTMFFQEDTLKNRVTKMDDEEQDQQLSNRNHLLVRSSKLLKFGNFVRLFNPDLLLLNPHLYTIFDELIENLIQNLPENFVIDYMINLCNRLLHLHNNPQIFGKKELSDISLQLIWLKHCVVTKVENISTIYKEKCLSGTQLGKMLSVFVKGQQLYGTYELLQYFQNQTKQIPDEFGRNQMFNSLQRALSEIRYFSPVYPLQLANLSLRSQRQNENKINIDRSIISDSDDICKIPTSEEIHTHKLMLTYYNLPIISCSLDLIYTLVFVMRALRPSHYEIQIKQIVSEINDPEQNSDIKDRQFILKDIQKIQACGSKKRESQSDTRLNYLHQRLRDLQIKCEENKQKTRIVILALSKVSTRGHIKDFWPLIQENIKKSDQSNGLLLLALECLQSLEQLEKFFQIFWMNLLNHDVEGKENRFRKNNLLVSLRAMSDFVMKFDLLDPKKKIDWNFQSCTITFTLDAFMQNLFQLLTHSDIDIRILAVQSLCRLLYHQKVHNLEWRRASFVYLLLLWWSTDSEMITAKCVHTISKFMKCYMDPKAGRSANQIKLAESFCIFFKLLMKQHREGKSINKSKVIYNLKLEEFMKKAIPVATGILRDRTQLERQIGQPRQKIMSSSLRAQELFILFLLTQEHFQNFVEKALEVSNFHESASSETLILVKHTLEKMGEEGRKTNKNETSLRRFEDLIQEQLQDRNEENYDTTIFKILSEELTQKLKGFNQDIQQITDKILQHQLFIQNDNQYDQFDEEADKQQSNESQSEHSGAESQAQSKIKQKASISLSPQPEKRPPLKKKNPKILKEIQAEISAEVEQPHNEVFSTNTRRLRKRKPETIQVINLDSSESQQIELNSREINSREKSCNVEDQSSSNQVQIVEAEEIKKGGRKNNSSNQMKRHLPIRYPKKTLASLKEEPEEQQRGSMVKRVTRSTRIQK